MGLRQKVETLINPPTLNHRLPLVHVGTHGKRRWTAAITENNFGDFRAYEPQSTGPRPKKKHAVSPFDRRHVEV